MALTKITPQMFDTSAAGHDFNIDNGTFVVDVSANRVGIGTATPSTLLHVDGTLTATSIAGTLTTAAQTNITSLGTLTTLTVDDITINGSTISDTGEFTLDIGGDINIDVDGGDINFKDGGTLFGQISNASGLYLVSNVSNAPMYLRGNDGGSYVNAITIDFANGGNVGVGTSSVDEILHVEKSSGTTLVKTEVASNSTIGFEIKKTGSTTSNWRIVDGQTINGKLEIYDVTNSRNVMTFDQNGNAGIGTISPSFDFEVNRATASATALISSGNNDAALRLYTANNVGKWRIIARTSDDLSIENLNSGATAFDTRLKIDSSGNVGIAVTPSAWSGFSGVAQVHNSALASVNNGTYLYANAYYDGSNNRHIATDEASRYYQLGGNHVWETAASQTAGSAVSFSEAMRINSSGNVGINDSSPSHLFTVKSDHATNPAVKIEQTGNTDGWGLATNNNEGRLEFSRIGGGVAGNHFVITNTGNVGIGTDSPSLASGWSKAVHVNGSAGAHISFTNSTTGSSNTDGLLVGQYSANSFFINREAGYQAFYTSNAERLRIRSDGKIDINLNANAYGTFSDNIGEVGAGNFCLQIAKSDLSALKPLGFRAEDIRFATGSSERLRIDSSGNLQIGSSSADGRLKISALSGNGASADLTLWGNNGGAYGGTNIAKSKLSSVSDGTAYGSNLLFYTNDTSNSYQEGMRIGSNGVLYVNGVSSLGSIGTNASGTGSNGTELQVNGAIEMGYNGRYTACIWGPTPVSASGAYSHLRTNMWGGGSPHGNVDYIMGGFIITGYRYASNANLKEIHQFHNWSGSLHNYTASNMLSSGNGWSGSGSTTIHLYVGSNGFVYIRLPSESTNYRMFMIDFIQYSQYNKINAEITAITVSNSATV